MSRNAALVVGVLIVLAAVLGFLVGRGRGDRIEDAPFEVNGRRRSMTLPELQDQLRHTEGERDKARAESEALTREVERLKAELAMAGTKATTQQGDPARPTPSTSGTPAAGVDRAQAKEAEVQTLLDGGDWLAYSKAIITYIQADEEARRLGKAAKVDPEVIKVLSEMNVRMEKLKELLGLESVEDVYSHERIAPVFGEGWLAALGIELDEDQARRLRESSIEDARNRREEKRRTGKMSALEDLLWEGEDAVRDDGRMRQVLTPVQYGKWGDVSNGNPFWGHEADRVTLAAPDASSMAGLVTNHWERELGLDAAHSAIVGEVATRYAQESQRLQLEFRARYPVDPPRDARMKLGVDLLRLQVEAERSLAERLTLTPEQQARVREGTGSILQMEWR